VLAGDPLLEVEDPIDRRVPTGGAMLLPAAPLARTVVRAGDGDEECAGVGDPAAGTWRDAVGEPDKATEVATTAITAAAASIGAIQRLAAR
jgi:hypothetical protein